MFVLYNSAWIKMAEYHYYGRGGQKNLQKAADFYCNAALSGDPQVIN